MTSVNISRENMRLAQKSMSRLYLAEFGEESQSDKVQSYNKKEFAQKYADNILFWKKHTPNVQPNMSEFSCAKHAICTNALQELWKVVDTHSLRDECEKLCSVKSQEQSTGLLQK